MCVCEFVCLLCYRFRDVFDAKVQEKSDTAKETRATELLELRRRYDNTSTQCYIHS